MRTVSITRTIKTVCGKTISYFQQSGEPAKAHSLEGPAVVYSKDDGKSPEYYVYGVRYTKAQWQDLVNQHKAPQPSDFTKFDIQS